MPEYREYRKIVEQRMQSLQRLLDNGSGVVTETPGLSLRTDASGQSVKVNNTNEDDSANSNYAQSTNSQQPAAPKKGRLSLSRIASIKDLERKFRIGSGSSNKTHQWNTTANFYLGYSLGELCKRRNISPLDMLRQLNALIKDYETFKQQNRHDTRDSNRGIRSQLERKVSNGSNRLTIRLAGSSGEPNTHNMASLQGGSNGLDIRMNKLRVSPSRIFRQRGGSIASISSVTGDSNKNVTSLLPSMNQTSSIPGNLLRKASLSSLSLSPMPISSGSIGYSISSASYAGSLSSNFTDTARVYEKYPLSIVPDTGMTFHCICEVLLNVYEQLFMNLHTARSTYPHGARELTDLLIKFDNKVNRHIIIPALKSPVAS